MGNVYLKCPVSGDIFWYDWTSYKDFLSRYVENMDKGRFFWRYEKG